MVFIRQWLASQAESPVAKFAITGAALVGTSMLWPGDFWRNLATGTGFEAGRRLGIHRGATGLKPWLWGGAGSLAVIGAWYGAEAFSGKDDNWNTIEGLGHSGLAGTIRSDITDFGSGWNALRGLLRAGETMESMVARKSFQKALKTADPVKELGYGVFGTVELMKGTFRGKGFEFARKTGAIRNEEVAAMRSVQETVGPTVYFTGKNVIEMEYFPGKILGNISAAERTGLKGEISAAFGKLHKAGYTHGDPHLGNIMLVDTPMGGAKVGLIDFGAAKKLSSYPTTREAQEAVAFEYGGGFALAFGGGINPSSRSAAKLAQSKSFGMRNLSHENKFPAMPTTGQSSNIRSSMTDFKKGFSSKIGLFKAAKRFFGQVDRKIQQAAKQPLWKTGWQSEPQVKTLFRNVEAEESFWKAAQQQREAMQAEKAFFWKGGTEPLPVGHAFGDSVKSKMAQAPTEIPFGWKTMSAETDRAIKELEAAFSPKGKRISDIVQVGWVTPPKSLGELGKAYADPRMEKAIKQFDEYVGEMKRQRIIQEQVKLRGHNDRFLQRFGGRIPDLSANVSAGPLPAKSVSVKPVGLPTGNLRKPIKDAQRIIAESRPVGSTTNAGKIVRSSSAVEQAVKRQQRFNSASQRAVGAGLKSAHRGGRGHSVSAARSRAGMSTTVR
jgi:predicted Ser/Thr protein kinase